MKQRSAVLTLITVICAFYLYELFDSGIIGTFALMRLDLIQESNQWYRLFTVALIHDNSSTIPIHLAFNMMALHQLGMPLERILGRGKFLIIFFSSLLAGSLFSSYYLWWESYSIGASGAVFGLFGAAIAMGRRYGGEVKMTLVIVAINFAIGFSIGGVDWHAHLGGLIGGYIVTKAFLLQKR